MSRRDLAHVLTALWNLSGGQAAVAVDVADIDEAIGRGRGDMRTALNLQSLGEEGLVVAVARRRLGADPTGRRLDRAKIAPSRTAEDGASVTRRIAAVAR